ncbi:hypothetical protein L1887_24078 [Cichorium endivia]|nr:hypothetical protein L1887_24078 [Cichorium endivia]
MGLDSKFISLVKVYEGSEWTTPSNTPRINQGISVIASIVATLFQKTRHHRSERPRQTQQNLWGYVRNFTHSLTKESMGFKMVRLSPNPLAHQLLSST